MVSAMTDISPYERIGADAGVRRLVDRFYDVMSELPETKGVLALHPASLDSSRDKLFWFLCGWLGGPQHFVERFGHPRLRARHLPFPIATSERDQWMLCMQRALDDTVDDIALRETLASSFAKLADHMINR